MLRVTWSQGSHWWEENRQCLGWPNEKETLRDVKLQPYLKTFIGQEKRGLRRCLQFRCPCFICPAISTDLPQEIQRHKKTSEQLGKTWKPKQRKHTQEAETGVSLWDQDWPCSQREFHDSKSCYTEKPSPKKAKEAWKSGVHSLLGRQAWVLTSCLPPLHWQTGMVTYAWNPTTGKAAICWLLTVNANNLAESLRPDVNEWPVSYKQGEYEVLLWLPHAYTLKECMCTQTQVYPYAYTKNHRYTHTHMGRKGRKTGER